MLIEKFISWKENLIERQSGGLHEKHVEQLVNDPKIWWKTERKSRRLDVEVSL
jgi:hypothetical protein